MNSVCFVAAPLIARSGVYNSVLELVSAGRKQGFQWSALLGVSHGAPGSVANRPGVEEFVAEPGGLTGVQSLANELRSRDAVSEADLVVSLIPQTDMALALARVSFVAYLRGRPWPARGEASRLKTAVWTGLERIALARAREVWATTGVLANEVGANVDRLVPPGIASPEPRPEGGLRTSAVWAARYSKDKNPQLFLDIMRDLDMPATMYGSGPLSTEVTLSAPPNVVVAGWAAKSTLWNDAIAYVGTSHREAFGRSAVEAAMLGVPPLISEAFGAAEMIYTDATLRELFVLPTADPKPWRRTLIRLAMDDDFASAVSDHVRVNAQRLTIESAVETVSAAIEDLIGNASRI